MTHSLTRRRLIQLGATSAGAGLLGGCFLRKKPQPVCPFDPAFTSPDAMLAIDVHAHVFNGADLQVKDFVSRIAIRQTGGLARVAEVFGGLLQSVVWHSAPTVAEEFRQLDRIQADIEACAAPEESNPLQRLRREKYLAGREELVAATRVRMQEQAVDPAALDQPTESLEPGLQGYQQILALPESYEDFFQPPGEDALLTEAFEERISVQSALQFLLEMFQYRYVSVYNYLDTYSRGSDIKVDLMTPAAVDFDWWLSQGKPTRSRLPEQMRLMQKITLLSGGRVHALVPFDPHRQVVHELGGGAGFDPLALVRTAVEEYGAVGVKMYPPLGFAPFGNEVVGSGQPDMWKRRAWLTEVAQRDDFPRRLDDSLARLYDYCTANGVPVMGHSNESNGPSEDFELLTGPDHWRRAVERFEGLNVSFGHFGGAGSNAGDPDANVRGFLDLLNADQDGRLYADASYFANVLDNPSLLATTLEKILTWPGQDPGAAVSRLMFGADWKMLAAEAGAAGYLQDFHQVFRHLESTLAIPGLTAGFFGGNAARYFGLARGRANRRRLEEFYDRHRLVQAPPWMGKVDALPGAG